jgi:hypothetical protein
VQIYKIKDTLTAPVQKKILFWKISLTFGTLALNTN